MNKTIDKFIQARNEVNATINSLVSEVLEYFDTYEEAIQAINKAKWDMTGSLGHYIIEEAGHRIKKVALKRAIKPIHYSQNEVKVKPTTLLLNNNVKTKSLLISEGNQGENYPNLTTTQLTKLVVEKIGDDVISVEIKKRHKSDELEACMTDPSQS